MLGEVFLAAPVHREQAKLEAFDMLAAAQEPEANMRYFPNITFGVAEWFIWTPLFWRHQLSVQGTVSAGSFLVGSCPWKGIKVIDS